jgi:hypothetical protein
MMNGRPLALLSVLAGLLLAGPARAQPDDGNAAETRAAQAAAQEWLDRLDDRDFEDAWEAAAAPFRERTDRDAWTRAATRLADSVGTAAARTRTSAQSRDSLRVAARPRPFVVLTYRTRFSGGRYEERLLVVREDEDWRVAGYEVRPLRTPDPPRSPRRPDGPGR